MSVKSYKVTVAGETVTVKTEAQTQTEIRQAAIDKLNNEGRVVIDEVQVYDCVARFSGCMYHVEGTSESNAAYNLETFLGKLVLGKLVQEAKDNVTFGSPEGDKAADLNTSAECKGESDSEAEIDLDGLRTDRY
jgi:hypothetical protein